LGDPYTDQIALRYLISIGQAPPDSLFTRYHFRTFSGTTSLRSYLPYPYRKRKEL